MEFFGGICKSLDDKLGNGNDGFLYCNKLIRYANFDADFERVWSETHGHKVRKKTRR